MAVATTKTTIKTVDWKRHGLATMKDNYKNRLEKLQNVNISSGSGQRTGSLYGYTSFVLFSFRMR